MDNPKGAKVPSKERIGETGFQQFVDDLTEPDILSNAIEIATILGFPPAHIDKIERDTSDGHVFPRLLQEKGFISQRDISPLIDALTKVGLHGIANKLQESFSRNVSCIGLSPVGTSEVQRKKEQFLKEITETYEDMYNGVQPVPYYRKRLFSVNDVFIDSGVEYFNKRGRKKAVIGTWEKLDSCYSVFTDPRLAHAMLYVLLGEPGYGKSTLALQYVYNWSNRCHNTPLKDVEILIFLRLRYLKGGEPVFKAIKDFLLPSDSSLTQSDIADIIQSCNSMIIVLDGFDEYAYQGDSTKDDVMKILARKMLRKCKVVLTTRPSCTLPELAYRTELVRLTGFDDQARKRYIHKAVVDGNSGAASKLLQQLQQSPVFADICQVTLFFVMFAHLAYEKNMTVVFESVTSFFRYVVSCFYEHKEIRAGKFSTTVKDMHPTENHELNKIAFESLKGKDKKMAWRRDIFLKLIGEPLYNELVETGILVEENVMTMVDDPGTSAYDHIQRRTDVSFYHKLFCEWYAANYMSQVINTPGVSDLKAFFEGIDPFELQYVFRIACGLNPAGAEKIIQYLHSLDGGDKFAILCILEQTGQVDKVTDTIREMCFEGVIISGYDSLLLQRSSMQLLEIAARKEIPIEYVNLTNCLQTVDLSTAAITTTSGLVLSSRISVKWLEVSLYNRDMTKDEATDILQFASMCSSLRQLAYFGCVPPWSFKVGPTLSTLKSRNVEVLWQWANDTPWYSLNLLSGRWENEDDGSEPTIEDFERMLSKRAEWRTGYTDEAYRRWVKKGRESLRKGVEMRRRDESTEGGDN